MDVHLLATYSDEPAEADGHLVHDTHEHWDCDGSNPVPDHVRAWLPLLLFF
jgi:hypothetical protein